VTGPIVTLTTDFGLQDSFVGAMKGVLLSRCPDVQIVDLCHDVPPQDVRRGALRLAVAAPFFPPGTVHLAVVDPGVGTARRPIAIQAGGSSFVGPDNGLLTLAAPRTVRGWRAVHLTRAEHWLPRVSATFHGRDIFAPVAARLAAGGTLDELGEPLSDVIELAEMSPTREGDRLRGTVTDVDRFGNLITTVHRSDLGGCPVERVEIAGTVIAGLSASYDPTRPLVAVLSSEDHLEIAVPGGSAADHLRATIDTPVDVYLRPAAPRGG
jgi:hypothetical protein